MEKVMPIIVQFSQVLISLATIALAVIAFCGLKKANEILQKQEQTQSQKQHVNQSITTNSTDLVKGYHCKRGGGDVDAILVLNKESLKLQDLHCQYLNEHNQCTWFPGIPPICNLGIRIENKKDVPVKSVS